MPASWSINLPLSSIPATDAGACGRTCSKGTDVLTKVYHTLRCLVVDIDRPCPYPTPWIPARYQRTGRALIGKTKWGRRVDVGGGFADGVLSRDVSAWIPAFAGMTNSGGRIDEGMPRMANERLPGAVYPRSESGTCFHSNRSWRLAPAHQGMKRGRCGLVRRIGTANSATPLLRPSGGQAPALHFLVPRSAMGLQLGRFRRWRAGIEVGWRAHSRTKARVVAWYSELVRRFLPRPSSAPAGDKPPHYIFSFRHRPSV